MRQRWYLLVAMIGAVLVLTACGGEERANDDPVPEDGVETAAQPMVITGLTWTSGVDSETGEPVDTVEAYTTISPAVVAVVSATNVPAGTEFTATWSIDGIDVAEATMSATVEEDLAVAHIAFEFVRDEGRYFPLGELAVVVTASSGESIDATVNIQLP